MQRKPVFAKHPNTQGLLCSRLTLHSRAWQFPAMLCGLMFK